MPIDLPLSGGGVVTVRRLPQGLDATTSAPGLAAILSCAWILDWTFVSEVWPQAIERLCDLLAHDLESGVALAVRQGAGAGVITAPADALYSTSRAARRGGVPPGMARCDQRQPVAPPTAGVHRDAHKESGQAAAGLHLGPTHAGASRLDLAGC